MSALNRDQILDAADEVLRKFGPKKANVVDVARLLGVSHGTIFRHFESKEALREAVMERWIQSVTQPLAKIVERRAKPDKRLRAWFEELMAIKRKKVHGDAEMFEQFSQLAMESKEIIARHLDMLISQVEQIVRDGQESGFFNVADCNSAAKSLFYGTYRFHHPVHSHEWGDKEINRDFDALFKLLMRGMMSKE